MTLGTYLVLALVTLLFGVLAAVGAAQSTADNQQAVGHGVWTVCGCIGFGVGVVLGIITGSWILHPIGCVVSAIAASLAGYHGTMACVGR